MLDARAFLAAARWGRDQHRAGSDQAALVGSSFGTNSAFWAVANHPRVKELQSGLRIGTLIFAGHTANNLVSRTMMGMVSSPSKDTRASAFLLATLGVGQMTATADEEEVLSSANIAGAVGRNLTAKGRALLTQTLVSLADKGKPACASVDTVPFCNSACLAATYASVVAPAIDPGLLTDWVSNEAAEAVLYDPKNGDPGANSTNAVLAMLRAQSPTLAAQGPLVTSRALVLLSDQDDVIVDQQPQGPAQLKAKLDALAMSWRAPAISSDSAGTCEHADYFVPTRNCGFSQIIDELQQALPR
jgi:pimeloyl-ACP methyl ester carboxylesterase